MAGGSTQWRGRSVISKVVVAAGRLHPGHPGTVPRRTRPDHRAAGVHDLPAGLRAGGVGRAGAGRAARATGRRAAVGARRAGAAQRGPARRRDAVHAGPVRVDPGERAPGGPGRPRGAVRRHDRRAGAPSRSGPGAAAGCRCTRPGSARCCWHTRRSSWSGSSSRPGCERFTPHTIVAPGAPASGARGGPPQRDRLRPGGDGLRPALGGLAGDGRRAATVVAALSVVLRSGRGDLRRLGPAVRTAAISTSRSLQERARMGGPLAVAGAHHACGRRRYASTSTSTG